MFVLSAERGLGKWRRGQRGDFRFEVVLPRLVAVRADVFAADSGNGLQQELGEIAEGYGLFLRDAALRRQKKDMSEGAVDVGGGGEVAAEACEVFVWKTVAATFSPFSRRMVSAELRTLATALAAVGESELTTGRSFGIVVDLVRGEIGSF